jgi:hypothetical protein
VTTTPESVLADDAPSWAVRLEAKIDVALIQQGATISSIHEKVDGLHAAVGDHDSRLDVLERSNFITPKGLAYTIVSTLTGVAAFIALLDRLHI